MVCLLILTILQLALVSAIGDQILQGFKCPTITFEEYSLGQQQTQSPNPGENSGFGHSTIFMPLPTNLPEAITVRSEIAC